ncbi:MAG: enoyl-CoA hydratase/isomerase family protein [Lautropia sp.]
MSPAARPSDGGASDAGLRVARHRAEPAGPVALTHVTLARAGKGNSLSAALVDELAAVLDGCEHDGTRVLLIDGDGSNFCTGFDLSNLDAESDDSLLARFVRVELLLQRLHRAPYLTIAVAHGRTWGAGADLFAACGQRWVRDGASFTFPGAAFGLLLGTARLAARVGTAQAEAWIASGARIDEAGAVAAGLATRRLESTEPADVVAAARALADASTRLDRETLAAIRNAAELRDAADDATDLARLVRSAARPGLRGRIQAYRLATAKR